MTISNKTLSQISGESALNTTTQLLDNTLATINSKMKQREQAQLHDLRGKQIEQASIELAELQKGVYGRDLQRKLLERETDYAIENFEEQKAISEDMQHFEYIGAKGQAADEVFDRILQAPDNVSKDLLLEQEGEVLPAEMLDALKDANWDSPSERKAIQDKAILDRAYLQKLSLERARASSTGASKITNIGFNQESMIMALKDNYDLGDKEVNNVVEVTTAIMKEYGDAGVRAPSTKIADAVAQTLQSNPDRYIQDNPGVFAGSTFNMEQLRIDTITNLQGGGIQAAQPQTSDDATWEAFKALNIPKGYSEQELRGMYDKAR